MRGLFPKRELVSMTDHEKMSLEVLDNGTMLALMEN